MYSCTVETLMTLIIHYVDNITPCLPRMLFLALETTECFKNTAQLPVSQQLPMQLEYSSKAHSVAAGMNLVINSNFLSDSFLHVSIKKENKGNLNHSKYQSTAGYG